MQISKMTSVRRTVAICGLAVLGAAGCKKTADNTINYKNALNTYYSAHPACLWSEEKKFPVQADTSDTTKTSPYDALVDQGLLARTTAEKKELIIISRQVTNYDLTDRVAPPGPPTRISRVTATSATATAASRRSTARHRPMISPEPPPR